MRRNINGITLIALVITIIVLLILVAIAISTLTGENGILVKAGQAKEETKKAEYKELIELLITEKAIEVSQDETITKPFIEIVKEAIEEKYDEWVENVIICDDNFDEVQDTQKGTKLIVETKDGYEIIVDIDNALKTGTVESITKGQAEKWTITFDLNGGSGKQPEEIKVRKKSSVLLPLGEGLTKPECKFVGWSTTENGEPIQEERYRPEGNVTLYAVWSQDTVVVTLNENGDTKQESKYNVIRGKDFIIPSPYTRNGYDLVGWSTSSDGNVNHNAGETIKIDEDITLYAKWTGKILLSLSLTNASNKATSDLTSGTKINVSVTSPTSEISNLMIKIGNVTVYNGSETGNTLNKSISIDSLANVDQLVSFSSYKVEAIATNRDRKQASASKEGITNYTIKSYEDLLAFTNLVNSGNNLSGKTVYLIKDLNLTGKTLKPIGSTENLAFCRYLRWWLPYNRRIYYQ